MNIEQRLPENLWWTQGEDYESTSTLSSKERRKNLEWKQTSQNML